ncbi:uncharacterized protein [Nicotiana tomentosiformis]|uniref:uncharacterized protein n=1 Tax=Nicotiana tomentosiformis TaxID=4098 RepID=UPI00388CB994
MDKISLDELVGNLKTQEMRKIEQRKEQPKRDKALVLKASEDDESDNDDPDLAIFAKFKRFMKNSKSASKREISSKSKKIDKANYDGCYMCSKLDHMVKDCLMWEIEWRKERAEKEKWEKMRENDLNKGKILAYEDSGSDKEEEKEDEAISLYAATDFDLWIIVSHGSILPTKMDSEGNKCNKREEKYDEQDRQLVQKNAKSVPCISAHDIRRTLEADFGDEDIEVALMAIEESKIDEEVIGMMDMSDSETEDETNELISNISCVKLDIKELESDKANLGEHVLELTSKNEKSPDIHGKGKMSDLQDKFEKELKSAKDNLCDAECRNKILQENLEKANYEFTRLSKWHRSSDALNWLNENCSYNKYRIGYRKSIP